MNNLLNWLDKSNYKIIGITGHAGAGKTSFNEALERSRKVLSYSADTRFIGDSNYRKKLLKAKQQKSIKSYLDACDQNTWWNWERIEKDLTELKQGKTVVLNEYYERATGKIADDGFYNMILPHDWKLAYEGAILGPPSILNQLDKIIFIASDPKVRLERLMVKDGNRRSLNEILARFLLTQASETKYYEMLFKEYKDKIVVIDNNCNFIQFNDKYLYEQQFIPVMV